MRKNPGEGAKIRSIAKKIRVGKKLYTCLTLYLPLIIWVNAWVSHWVSL